MSPDMSRNRGQTTLDFAIGTSVFLLAVVFVVAYAPTLFDPFAGGTGTDLLVADRAATSLSADLLAASTAEPGTLSTGCVVAFFEEDGSLADEECATAFDVAGETAFEQALSLDGRNANVTIQALDTSSAEPAEIRWDGSDTELTRSNSGSAQREVAVATRTVSIGGNQYRLTVRVW
jgi:hypothetical protein